MNIFFANLFLVPIGFGSPILLFLSAHNDDKNIFSPFTDNNTFNTEISMLLLISFIYFSSDIILMINKYNSGNNIYFVHHSIGIISIMLVYFNNYHLIKYLLAYLSYELSTPFLNMAVWCRRNNFINKYTFVIDIVFFVMFTVVRIIFGSYLLYQTVQYLCSIEGLKYISLFPILLQSLNYFWYSKISLILYRKIICRIKNN